MCSSFRMAYIASCLQELLPFVYDNSLLIRILQWPGHSCPMDTFLVIMLHMQQMAAYLDGQSQFPNLSVCVCVFGGGGGYKALYEKLSRTGHLSMGILVPLYTALRNKCIFSEQKCYISKIKYT